MERGRYTKTNSSKKYRRQNQMRKRIRNENIRGNKDKEYCLLGCDAV
jgi:hypothetical protein